MLNRSMALVSCQAASSNSYSTFNIQRENDQLEFCYFTLCIFAKFYVTLSLDLYKSFIGSFDPAKLTILSQQVAKLSCVYIFIPQLKVGYTNLYQW